jgi:Protein of unknown function (DUF2652)
MVVRRLGAPRLDLEPTGPMEECGLAATASTTRIQGALVLADISGYTGFLNGVAEAHRALVIEAPEPPAAYGLMSSLLETVAGAIIPPFHLAKLEGDAVFAVAANAELPIRGTALLEALRACHAAFAVRLGEANALWSCTCGSCARVDQLGLKFVLHHGDYFALRIAGQEEVVGPDVIVAHRLLKNHARDLVGERPYVLLTDAAADALAIPLDDMLPFSEAYEQMPPIPVHVLPLGERE